MEREAGQAIGAPAEPAAGDRLDHPIFIESVRRIRLWLGDTGLEGVEQEVLERLVHSSGDPGLAPLLRFSPGPARPGSKPSPPVRPSSPTPPWRPRPWRRWPAAPWAPRC